MTETNVHLGCGKRHLPGYVHVDLADFPHIDHRHDVKSLPMLSDESVDLIYACHVLEYFAPEEVTDVLTEWRRVLKPNGKLRVAVPDFESLAAVYRKTGDVDLVRGPIFGRWQIPGTETTIQHNTVYDFASLEQVLTQAGFSNVRRWDWRDVFTGPLKGYDDYSQAYVPHMDKEAGTLVSLNVEANR